MKTLTSLLALLLVSAIVTAQQAAPQQSVTIRVCTYNVVNYTDTATPARKKSLQTVLAQIQPDFLILQGFTTSGALNDFKRKVIAPINEHLTGLFAADNELLYDSSKATIHGTLIEVNGGRSTIGWIMRLKATGDTIRFYGMNLQEGSAAAHLTLRSFQASLLRRELDRLRPGALFLLAGGFNIASSSDSAYQRLTLPSDSTLGMGQSVDPIDRPGDWQGNTGFTELHTSSSRVRAFDSGLGGGLHDRFDQILVSAMLLPHYKAGSYTTFGNDGHHFNDSINSMPNLAVDSATAQALHDASDHLPVYLDLVFTTGTSGVEERRRMPTEMDLTDGRRTSVVSNP
jgi:endonuclease/exonuclease/phosphatase family metal-dependent hydrolase